jgi:C1A family cysteine protease
MLDLDRLRENLAERGYDWQPKRTNVLAAAERHGGKVFLGVRVDPAVAHAQFTLAHAAPPSRYDALPAPPRASDWRTNPAGNFVTPIRDQGTCGACVAFATCAVAESRIAIAQADADPDLDLSEAGLFFCSARCANGWWPEEAMDRARTNGIGSETSFPYPGKDVDCRKVPPLVNVTGWDTPEQLRHRKQAIAFNGPVVAVFKVFEDFLFYGSGVYRHVSGPYLGLHAVAVVGYDDDARAWIIKNSWSTRWGEDGFGRIGYNECGIDTEYVFWDPNVIRHADAAAIAVGTSAPVSAGAVGKRRKRK